MRLINKLFEFRQNKKKYPLQKINGHDVIFIHINKTGGTSVLNVLNLSKSHLTAKEVIGIVGEYKFKSSFKFAAVRNPWDKVVSHYKYRIQTNQTNLGTNTIPFSEWVEKTYGKNKDSFYYDKPKMFQPQVEWLKNQQDKIDINEIMKFEDLNSEFKRVAEILGLRISLPHLNETNRVNYRDYYDSETQAIIALWFAEDIRLFKYEF
jgi:hypothetical protein